MNTGGVGCAGKGGIGGNAAENGCSVEVEYIHILYFFDFSLGEPRKKSNGATRSGPKGDDGGNDENIEQPPPPNSFHDKVIVKEYIEYMASKMTNSVQQSILNEFKKELEKDSVLSAFETVKHGFKLIYRKPKNVDQNVCALYYY